MAFVKLSKDGEPIWINSDRIAYFEATEATARDGAKRPATRVWFDGEMSLVIDEPIDQLRYRFQ